MIFDIDIPFVFCDDMLQKNRKISIKVIKVIKVINKEEKDIYYWSVSKFMNRYFLIKDIYENYLETLKLKKIK